MPRMLPYPKEVRVRIARRKKKGHIALPPLAAMDKVYPTWHGIFIGYNIKLALWQKFLTPKDVMLIAQYNGLDIHYKNISLAMGGRMLPQNNYDTLCKCLHLHPRLLRQSIPKVDRSRFHSDLFLFKKFNWNQFLGPVSPEEAKWAKENLMAIAKHIKSRHLPSAMRIVDMRHKKLSQRLGIPISEKTVFR